MESGNKFTYIYLSKQEVEIYFRLLTFPDEFGAFPTENVHFPMERTNFSEDFCISRQIEPISCGKCGMPIIYELLYIFFVYGARSSSVFRNFAVRNYRNAYFLWQKRKKYKPHSYPCFIKTGWKSCWSN